MEKSLGGWAFVIGLIIAIVIALTGNTANWALYLLVVLGLIVGLLNISDKEVNSFLIAAIAFMLTFGSLSAVFANWLPVARFLQLLVAFVAPAAAVVAFKALFAHTRD